MLYVPHALDRVMSVSCGRMFPTHRETCFRRVGKVNSKHVVLSRLDVVLDARS